MTPKKPPKGLLIFALCEVAIGFITILGVSLSIVLEINVKPANILAFVYVTSLLSLWLGIGLLNFNIKSYELLIFLAGVIILTKVLIFAGIIHLNGALETNIAQNLKNTVSIVYHTTLLWYLNLRNIKKLFVK
ncbi:hypothetical protein ACFL2J_03555 [Candidatus Omnitrophota bacterium]